MYGSLDSVFFSAAPTAQNSPELKIHIRNVAQDTSVYYSVVLNDIDSPILNFEGNGGLTSINWPVSWVFKKAYFDCDKTCEKFSQVTSTWENASFVVEEEKKIILRSSAYNYSKTIIITLCSSVHLRFTVLECTPQAKI